MLLDAVPRNDPFASPTIEVPGEGGRCGLQRVPSAVLGEVRLNGSAFHCNQSQPGKRRSGKSQPPVDEGGPAGPEVVLYSTGSLVLDHW
jgi:hypothetical protein